MLHSLCGNSDHIDLGIVYKKMEESGIEPEAFRMRNGRSTTELHPHLNGIHTFKYLLKILKQKVISPVVE